MPFKTGGSTTDNRKYWTPEHRRYRASLVEQLKREGFLLCTAKVCVFRSRHITNPKGRERDGLHAGHNDAGTDYVGPQHNACNVRDGGVRGRARQNRKRSQLKWLQGEAAPRPWLVQDNHPCPICSASVTWQTQRCCSRACANDWRRRQREALPPKVKPLPAPRLCAQCELTFIPADPRQRKCNACRFVKCLHCDTMMPTTRTTRPEGEAICHPCRRDHPQRHRPRIAQ